jgi:hypothetical protein
MSAHAGHRTATLFGKGPDGRPVGGVICTCGVVVCWLPRCPAATVAGGRCRNLVRADLGHRACPSHSGRSGRPRQIRALGVGTIDGHEAALSRRAL